MAAARALRIPLAGSVAAADAALLVRGDERPFALSGDWAGGAAVVGSEPVITADPQDDPFELLDRQPEVDDGGEAVVGGGWFGYLGYALGARLERVPAGPRRPQPLPDFSLCFYDHLLRLDGDGRWWFEALWTAGRDAALHRRLSVLRARLADGVDRRPAAVGRFEPAAPGAAGHVAAVAACRERIAAGEIFQANLCLRLEASFAGDPLDLFARTTAALAPRHAALVAGPWGALCSASPELFLRRRGRSVVTEPIKGSAPRAAAAERALSRSAKDRAENVMIVDLMRNDLGRVCGYGNVNVTSLTELRPAPGVWHLVSTVAGRLRPGIGDGDLLRASFPPGSVTGAPKIQAMRVIAELESTGREAYTGAIGYASPIAGLELNVAIRTLELSGERVWLGVGGGVVADSDPARELEECLFKARPVVAAAGGSLAEPAVRSPAADAPPFALTGGAERPDPALGVFSTLLVVDGVAVDLAAHLARLEASAAAVYGQPLPEDVPARVRASASEWRLARMRVSTTAGPGDAALVELDTRALDGLPEPRPVVLEPVLLPGGLGQHKWRDRRLVDELTRRLGAVPLFVDLDGEAIEAGYANLWIVEGDLLITPPLDGRALPGTVRARILARPPAGFTAREEAVPLERLTTADAILLSSSLRGVHPATLRGAEHSFDAGVRVRDALERDTVEAGAP